MPISRHLSFVVEWDARDGGCWRYVASHDGQEFGFRGCFHQISADRFVQTFTFEGMPDDVALETMTFEDLGDGYTRLHAQSLVDSFEGRVAVVGHGGRRERRLHQARRGAHRALGRPGAVDRDGHVAHAGHAGEPVVVTIDDCEP